VDEIGLDFAESLEFPGWLHGKGPEEVQRAWNYLLAYKWGWGDCSRGDVYLLFGNDPKKALSCYERALQIFQKIKYNEESLKQAMERRNAAAVLLEGSSGVLAHFPRIHLKLKSSREKYDLQVQVGRVYLIEGKGEGMRAIYIRLEDDSGKELARDSSKGAPPYREEPRLIFTPNHDGIYRIELTGEGEVTIRAFGSSK
jgi:hypothetical protein